MLEQKLKYDNCNTTSLPKTTEKFFYCWLVKDTPPYEDMAQSL